MSFLFNPKEQEKIKEANALVDRENAFYKKEQYLAIEKEIEAYRKEKNREIEDLAKRCAEEIGKYEHTFHSTMEKLGIDIAKQEAKKEALAQILAQDKVTFEKILAQKDAEIVRLAGIITELIKKPCTTTIQTK